MIKAGMRVVVYDYTPPLKGIVLYVDDCIRVMTETGKTVAVNKSADIEEDYNAKEYL